MAWAPTYVTLDEMRSYAQIPASDTESDIELALAAYAASRAIDLAAGRQFGIVDAPEQRTYAAAWDRHLGAYMVEIDDLMTTTGLVITAEDGTSIDVDDVTLTPLNAANRAVPWTRMTMASSPGDVVNAVASWGWTTVPEPIPLATRVQGSRFFKRQGAPFGIAGSPESEMRLLDRVDPDVAVMVATRRRWWAAR